MTNLKLPRNIEAHPQHEALKRLLSQDQRLLWKKGTVRVPAIRFNTALEKALTHALALKHLERGLERIDQVLTLEKKGLQALQEKQCTPPAYRVSRILLLANDGAERFYRGCESTLLHNQDRLLGLWLDAGSLQLGLSLFGPEKPVKALLVSDKEAATQVLLSLLESR
jgi:hypothetical protein